MCSSGGLWSLLKALQGVLVAIQIYHDDCKGCFNEITELSETFRGVLGQGCIKGGGVGSGTLSNALGLF